jgi:hypothetical protein
MQCYNSLFSSDNIHQILFLRVTFLQYSFQAWNNCKCENVKKCSSITNIFKHVFNNLTLICLSLKMLDYVQTLRNISVPAPKFQGLFHLAVSFL